MDAVSQQPQPQTPMSTQALQDNEGGSSSSGEPKGKGVLRGFRQFSFFPSAEAGDRQPAAYSQQEQTIQQEVTSEQGAEVLSQEDSVAPSNVSREELPELIVPFPRRKAVGLPSALRNEISVDAVENVDAQQGREQEQVASAVQGQAQGGQQAQAQDQSQAKKPDRDSVQKCLPLRGGATGNCCDEPFGCCTHWMAKICGFED